MSNTISVKQFAKRLGVGPNKVCDWIHDGQLIAINAAARTDMRPRWRIPLEEIERFMVSRLSCGAAS